MKRAISTSILFFSLALVPMSCDIFCLGDCNCNASAIKDFKIESFEVYTMTLDHHPIDPANPNPYSQVMKRFQIKEILSAQLKDKRYNAFGSAYACSPRTPNSVDTLIGIRITNKSEQALSSGENLLVGQDLTPFFDVGLWVSQRVAIPEFLSRPIYLNLEDQLILIWNKAPEKTMQLQFDVKLIFEDNLEFDFPDEILSIY